MTKEISVRLSEKLAAKVDKLAALAGRPPDWLIKRMIEDYVDKELLQVAAIKEAMDDLRAGRSNFRPHAEVMAELDQFLREKIGDAEFDRLINEEEKERRRRKAKSKNARSMG